jgi:N-acetyl-alpha-D-glucosaminyl L-malate synthase BshA
MKSLNIAICCFASIGGSGVIATELGKGLASNGHNIHFVCSDIPFRLEDFTPNIRFHQVHTFPYPAISTPQYDLALASRLAEVIDEENIDIVHCHYAIPHAVSAFLAKQIVKNKHVKIITTLHGTDTSLVGLHPCYFGITKFAIEAADGVTAVSEWLANQSHTDFGVPYPEVIPNFVDIDRFTPDNYSINYRNNFARIQYASGQKDLRYC